MTQGLFQFFKTDHSSVLITISNYNFFKPSPGLSKFNNSLIKDETFTLKNFIQNMINKLENALDNDDNLESYHNIKNKIEEIYEKRQKAQE